MAGCKNANKKEKEQEQINRRSRNRFDLSVFVKEYLKSLRVFKEFRLNIGSGFGVKNQKDNRYFAGSLFPAVSDDCIDKRSA